MLFLVGIWHVMSGMRNIMSLNYNKYPVLSVMLLTICSFHWIFCFSFQASTPWPTAVMSAPWTHSLSTTTSTTVTPSERTTTKTLHWAARLLCTWTTLPLKRWSSPSWFTTTWDLAGCRKTKPAQNANRGPTATGTETWLHRRPASASTEVSGTEAGMKSTS